MPCSRRPHSDRSASRRRLYRDTENSWFAGVCAGIADYLGLKRGLVRLLTVMLAIPFTFTMFAAYVILALILRHKPLSLYRDAEEENFWREVRVEPSRTTGDLKKKFERIERRLRQAEARVTASSFRLRRAFRDLERGV